MLFKESPLMKNLKLIKDKSDIFAVHLLGYTMELKCMTDKSYLYNL